MWKECTHQHPSRVVSFRAHLLRLTLISGAVIIIFHYFNQKYALLYQEYLYEKVHT